MAKKSFDFVIVGGGLSGCLAAKMLSRFGNPSVALIEAAGNSGSWRESDPFGIGRTEVSFLPAGEPTDRAIEFVEGLLGHSLEATSVSESPLTVEKGALVPFIGFGEKVPKEVDELMPYLGAERIETTPHPSRWIFHLRETLPAEVFTRSQATRVEVDQGQITGVVINGDQKIEGKYFIFCVPPTEALKLLPQNAVDPKLSHKLSRSKLWTSISLDLVHGSAPGQAGPIHLIQGGEHSVCLGQIRLSATGEHLSQWMSFVPGDELNEEAAATTLREMKRLIKKAYPQALDNLKFERLVVRPNSHGTVQLKMDTDFSLPGLENLWLCSSLMRAEKNLVGSALQVQRIGAALQRLLADKAGAKSLSEAQDI